MRRTPCSHAHLRTLSLYLLIAITAGLGTAACTPPTRSGPTDPSRPTITAAATALDKRDAASFVETLSTPQRSVVADRLDLSGPGAAQMAQALRNAKVVAEYDLIRVYETTVGGETFSFMAVREGDKWMLSGL